MLLMMPHMFWRPIPGYLAIIAVLAFPVVFLYGGIATNKSTWRSLKNGTFNMDVLISMGSLPPYLIGLVGFVYPMTSFIEMAATIMTFHLLGRYLEALAKGRASQAIRRLMTLGAKTARVERDGEEVEVAVKELAPGDIMVVRPGDKIPTDGEVVEGESHLDESIATGESIPVYKSTGDSVIGATITRRTLAGQGDPRRRRYLPLPSGAADRPGSGLAGTDPGIRRSHDRPLRTGGAGHRSGQPGGLGAIPGCPATDTRRCDLPALGEPRGRTGAGDSRPSQC